MATPVFFMHDGAVDELVCIPFLQSMSNIDLSGIWITPSDCLGGPTATVCGQLMQFIGNQATALFLSDSSSERPFPWTYRQYSLMVNLLPLLNPSGQNVMLPTTRKISRTPRSNASSYKATFDHIKKVNDIQGDSTIFLITCPLTDFAQLLESNSAMIDEVQSVTWMGGTLNAGGNIDTGIAIGANPNAEWNAYWDPYAVQTVLQSGLPINMFPLDVTNSFNLTPAVLQQYFLPSAANSPMMNLTCQMYALVAFQAGFCFWDTAAAASLGNSDLFTFTSQSIAINTDDTDYMEFGCISTSSSGDSVNIASLANGQTSVSDFYDYLTNQLINLSIAG